MVRRIHLTLMYVLAGTVAILAGCRAPMEPTAPTLARVSIESPEEYDALWIAADKALRKFDLPPDRTDRTEGVIVSHGQTSAAWFELWRSQPKPGYAWWESNLHTIRRRAKVTMQPTTSSEYELCVQVDRYQFSLEERQIDNPAAVQRLYGGMAPTASTGRSERQAESGRWIPRGRDGRLEEDILTDILKRFGSGRFVTPVETLAGEAASSPDYEAGS